MSKWNMIKIMCAQIPTSLWISDIGTTVNIDTVLAILFVFDCLQVIYLSSNTILHI